MMNQRYSNPHREERYKVRAKRARFWAWPVRIALFGCVGAAIWQEPTLSPRGHAVLKDVAARVGERLDGSDGTPSYLAAFYGASQGTPDN